jgi:tRNA A-37 threonylcarbamoyl transferase component Bud32
MHAKEILHNYLKADNVVLHNGSGYIINLGKASTVKNAGAKKYTVKYNHISPEVQNYGA